MHFSSAVADTSVVGRRGAGAPGRRLRSGGRRRLRRRGRRAARSGCGRSHASGKLGQVLGERRADDGHGAATLPWMNDAPQGRSPARQLVELRCNITYITCMAKRSSGRVVVVIEPALKRDLYVELTRRGLTLKSWFVEQAARFLEQSRPAHAVRRQGHPDRQPASRQRCRSIGRGGPPVTHAGPHRASRLAASPAAARVNGAAAGAPRKPASRRNGANGTCPHRWPLAAVLPPDCPPEPWRRWRRWRQRVDPRREPRGSAPLARPVRWPRALRLH